jgi:putative ABC transport system permease protein
MPLGPALKADLPDVQQSVRFRDAWGENFVRIGEAVHRQGITFADPQVFSVFSFPLMQGDPATALRDPQGLVLTAQATRQLFGEANPMGQTVEIQIEDAFEPFTVTGVAADLPANSTIQFGLLLSFERWASSRYGLERQENWGHSAYHTFVQLHPGSNLAQEAGRLLTFRRKYYPNEEAELRAQGYWKDAGPPVTYRLQPLQAMHTETHIWGGFTPAIDPKNIWILLGLAASVLLIACINFTTLAIGRSAGRAREVGIRKVVGSHRGQLIGQFLVEALLLSGVSALLGMALAYLLLPFFNALAGRELAFSWPQYPEMVWLLVGVTLVVGLVAGSYPALALSRFRPVEVLKHTVRLGGANLFTRLLVTLQFVLSVGLIACMLIMVQQIRFLQDKHPGFDKENVVVVDATGTDTPTIWPRFREAAARQPGVLAMASAEVGLGADMGWSRSGWDYQGQHKEAYEYFVDDAYLSLMKMTLVAGRNFDPQISSDTTTSVIVNEAFVRDFGWTTETAIGQELTGYSEQVTPVVIGVVKDFHFRSFHEAVAPQLFHQFADYQPFRFLVRLTPGNPAPALEALGQTWTRLVPDVPFKYSFLDDDLDRFYRAEVRLGTILGWAAGTALFLACLGLFGLATLAAVNRTKEIGIRKVLGASLASLVTLFSQDFLKLVGLAFVIATPLAWLVMQRWLEHFAYRIEPGVGVFALAGLAAVVIAFATVGYQALRTALADPVKSLRYE